MNATSRAPRFARFGLFELDLRTGELRKKGLRVRLQEQPFRVLAMLVERAGDVVMREELRQRLWPDSVFVDFDTGLNKAVAKIRVALGDSAESPRFVETLERRGYRFLADVSFADLALPPSLPALTPATAPLVRLLWDDRTVAFTEGVHTIGRDPACALWVDSSVVSRRHASLTVAAGGVSIEDHGSRNGTFVNGRRIDAARVLLNGDEIRIGPARLTVRLPGPIEPTATAQS